MLVLTRKPGEQIIIGDNIRITVVSIGPGRVKIGVDAPANVKVDRQEVYDKRQADQEPAQPVVIEVEPEMVLEVPVLHNRIADKLPPAETPTSAPLENRLKGIDRRFPPRKPR